MEDLKRIGWLFMIMASHYRRHPLQAFFLFVGLVTGVTLWVAVQFINEHARASYLEADQFLGAQATHWIKSKAETGVILEDYIKLRRSGFRQIYPVLDVRLASADQQPINLIATDLLALPPIGRGEYRDAKNWQSLTQFPFQAWYPATLAKRLNIIPGEKLSLSSGISLPPAIIQTKKQQGERIFMDIGAAMTVLNRTSFSYLAVAGLSDEEASRLSLLLPSNLKLVTNERILDLSELTQSLHTHLNAMSLLSFAVGFFIVFNAVHFSLRVRTQTLTILQEIGVSIRSISLAIAVETLLLSLLGTGFGLIIGYALGQALLPVVASTLQSLYGAVLDHHLILQPVVIFKAWSLTLSGLVLALAFPLWSRTRQTILKQRELIVEKSEDRKILKRFILIASGLAVLAILMYPSLSTAAHWFVMLALILFSAAFILPVLLALSLSGIQALLPERSWRLRWALSDGWTQLPGLRIALMALLLTLSANVGVDTLVGSFRIALTDYLQQRMSADVYVQTENLNIQKLLQSPEVENHHLRYLVTLRWKKRKTLIRGMDTQAPDTLILPIATADPEGLESWYANKDGVILANEQAQHLTGIKLGDNVEFDTPTGLHAFKVVGFYYDYGNSTYGFYLPFDRVKQYWPKAELQSQIAVWFKEAADLESILLHAGAQAGDWLYGDDILQVSLSIFNRTFAITAAMNVLTLAVAGIALFASLLAIHQQRLPEYAHWKSMGLKQTEWLGLIILPLGVCVLVTWGLSIPLGSLMAMLMIEDLNVISFGWTMPIEWSWEPAARLLVITTGVVILTLVISLTQVHFRLPQALKQLGGDNG